MNRACRIILVVVVATAAIAFMAVAPHKRERYPYPDVADAIRNIPRTSNLTIELERTSNPLCIEPSSKLRAINRWLGEVFGKGCPDPTDEYRFVNGTDHVQVIIHHTNFDTGRVEIRPKAGPSAAAMEIKEAILKSFPNIDCRIVNP